MYFFFQVTVTNEVGSYRFVIIIQYNMYHKRPLEAQNTRPIRMPEGGGRIEAKAVRPGSGAGGRAAGHSDRGAILAGATDYVRQLLW